MAVVGKITGVEQVIGRLRKSQTITGRGVSRGLKEAGKFLFRESQAIVPVHQGHLKGSGFIRRRGIGFKTDVIVGYTAKYAVYVHENLDAVHGTAFNIRFAEEIGAAHTPAQKKMWFNREPNQQAKFLEKPARTKRKKLLQIIAREART